MIKYWRLLKRIRKGILNTYRAWRVDECYRRDPENVYNCATCGVANLLCKHWRDLLARQPQPIE